MSLLLQAICHIHGFLLGLSDHFLSVDLSVLKIKKTTTTKQLFTLIKKCINILPNWNKANAHFGNPEQTASVEVKKF